MNNENHVHPTGLLVSILILAVLVGAAIYYISVQNRSGQLPPGQAAATPVPLSPAQTEALMQSLSTTTNETAPVVTAPKPSPVQEKALNSLSAPAPTTKTAQPTASPAPTTSSAQQSILDSLQSH